MGVVILCSSLFKLNLPVSSTACSTKMYVVFCFISTWFGRIWIVKERLVATVLGGLGIISGRENVFHSISDCSFQKTRSFSFKWFVIVIVITQELVGWLISVDKTNIGTGTGTGGTGGSISVSLGCSLFGCSVGVGSTVELDDFIGCSVSGIRLTVCCGWLKAK